MPGDSTENRSAGVAGNPTREQIEAAAKAICVRHSTFSGHMPACDNCLFLARAALAAARVGVEETRPNRGLPVREPREMVLENFNIRTGISGVDCVPPTWRGA